MEWVNYSAPYKSGKCPVESYVIVDTKDRSGKITTGVKAGDIGWYNSYSSFDVVAYKVVEDPYDEVRHIHKELCNDIDKALQDNLLVLVMKLEPEIVHSVIMNDQGELVMKTSGYGFCTDNVRKDGDYEGWLWSQFKFYKEYND